MAETWRPRHAKLRYADADLSSTLEERIGNATASLFPHRKRIPWGNHDSASYLFLISRNYCRQTALYSDSALATPENCRYIRGLVCLRRPAKDRAMNGWKAPSRLLITVLLMISLGGVPLCSCDTLPQAADTCDAPHSPKKSCCCHLGAGHTCGMACCLGQSRPIREPAPFSSGSRGNHQTPAKFVLSPTVAPPFVIACSPIAVADRDLQSRLAPPTLQSQHICLQI